MANETTGATVATGTSKAEIGAQIITQTLDKINSGGKKTGGSDMSDTYNFSKQVLSAVYEGKGSIADSNG